MNTTHIMIFLSGFSLTGILFLIATEKKNHPPGALHIILLMIFIACGIFWLEKCGAIAFVKKSTVDHIKAKETP